eukprot:TRINITY_DN15022_c0_g1_i1.p1 TRINITY_DN15022_c0_g1~~TRINITY_DN15022_c0_g1_i1.p1  ORF type:complete len:179 (-),score=26.47 TRINITY_DN15022_c0_g1_i1:114-614(-)
MASTDWLSIGGGRLWQGAVDHKQRDGQQLPHMSRIEVLRANAMRSYGPGGPHAAASLLQELASSKNCCSLRNHNHGHLAEIAPSTVLQFLQTGWREILTQDGGLEEKRDFLDHRRELVEDLRSRIVTPLASCGDVGETRFDAAPLDDITLVLNENAAETKLIGNAP